MSNLLVLVLDDINQCPHVLTAWEKAGATGATILESTGMRRMQARVLRDDMPLFPSMRNFLEGTEFRHRTLFTVIEDDAVLERVIAATEEVIGDFTRHNTGLLFVVPVTRVLGLEKRDVEGR
ncbi:MAG: hypothetical protein ACE5NP_09165 [Anaerolineae bacterium]